MNEPSPASSANNPPVEDDGEEEENKLLVRLNSLEESAGVHGLRLNKINTPIGDDSHIMERTRERKSVMRTVRTVQYVQQLQLLAYRVVLFCSRE